MKVAVYTRLDGGVSIMRPGIRARRLEDETDDAFMTRIMAISIPPDASDIRVIDESEVPADKTFRNAWTLGTGIEVDRAKAEALHMDRIRVVRDRELGRLDKEIRKAEDEGGVATELRAERGRLGRCTGAPAWARPGEPLG